MEFLEVRARRFDPLPAVHGLCVGYELGEWRGAQLASHLMKWLPEFALKYSERLAIGEHNAVEVVARAARSVYRSPKYQTRGELGELLLHAVVRQVFDTVPAISKLFYKDGANETVKGFDAVHVVPTSAGLELWLGEVKFYEDISKAMYDVAKEIDAHLARDYLKGEFAAVTNKIDAAWQHSEALKKLIHEETSLDEVFSKICIPVLLTYESKSVNQFTSVCADYVSAFQAEVFKYADAFGSKALPGHVRIELLLVPLKSKAELVDAFDVRLRYAQEMI